MDSIVLFVYLYLDAQSASADFFGTHEMYLPKKKIQGEEEEPAGESTIPVWVTGTTTGIYLTSRRRRGRKKKTDDHSGKSTESSPFHFFSFFFSSTTPVRRPFLLNCVRLRAELIEGERRGH
jgi:hypothetical protein